MGFVMAWARVPVLIHKSCSGLPSSPHQLGNNLQLLVRLEISEYDVIGD